MELVDFLRARLDEDEAIARAASGSTVVGEPGSWKPSPAGDEWEVSRDDGYADELLVALRTNLPRPPEVLGGYWGVVVGYRWESEEPGSGAPLSEFAHAARHDPARVLAEVEAKRQLTARGGPFCTSNCDEPGNEPMDPDTNWTTPLEHHFGCGAHEAAKLFARPFRDHPDFDPAWLED